MAENLILHPFFTNILLPFIFSFVLLYALMEKIKLLGENKQAHLLIALAMSFFFVGIPSLLNITSIIIPVITILVIIAFCLMLLFGILGIEFYKQKNYHAARGWIAAILILVGLAVVGSLFGWTQKLLPLLKPEVIQVFAFLIITGVVIWMLLKFGGSQEGGGGKSS